MRQRKSSNGRSIGSRKAGSRVSRTQDQHDSSESQMDLADAKRSVLAQGWLSEKDMDFQKALLDKASLQHFPAGSRVFEVGDFRGGFYGVVSGAFGVKVSQQGGEERLAHIARAGEWFGFDPPANRRTRTLAIEAIEPATVLMIPLPVMDQLAASDPNFLRILTSNAAHGMDVAIATVSDLLIPDAEKRIASSLLRISAPEDVKHLGARVVTGLTQAQIGELTNVKRDIVNRTLKRFEKRGWIAVSYKRVTVLDPTALRAFCS